MVSPITQDSVDTKTEQLSSASNVKSSQCIPTKGLVIKSPYIEKILAGTKTWEMRSSSTKIRGPIALIKKGSGKIIGVANLVGVKGPLSEQEKRDSIDKHQISIDRLESGETGKWNTAWVLENVRPLVMPVHYQHPNGAVIWVNLDVDTCKKIVNEFQVKQ